jgi:hypothetical protein
MQAQQRRFLNVIGLSTERALHVHNIKPIEDLLNEQCVNIVHKGRVTSGRDGQHLGHLVQPVQMF